LSFFFYPQVGGRTFRLLTYEVKGGNLPPAGAGVADEATASAADAPASDAPASEAPKADAGDNAAAEDTKRGAAYREAAQKCFEEVISKRSSEPLKPVEPAEPGNVPQDGTGTVSPVVPSGDSQVGSKT
jgi:hypothetical protein